MFLGLIPNRSDGEPLSPKILSYTYDPASQVTNILHQLTASSAQINKADYLYNGVGNRTSLTDKRGAQIFGYDTLDRLTTASHPFVPSARTADVIERFGG